MIKELHNLVYIMLSHEKFMGGRIVDYRIEKRFIKKILFLLSVLYLKIEDIY